MVYVEIWMGGLKNPAYSFIAKEMECDDKGISVKITTVDDEIFEVSPHNIVVQHLNKDKDAPPPTVANPDTPTETDFKYFTAYQVRNMSQKEVKENYADIMKSMKKW